MCAGFLFNFIITNYSTEERRWKEKKRVLFVEGAKYKLLNITLNLFYFEGWARIDFGHKHVESFMVDL